MVNFTAADRVGSILGYVGTAGELLGRRGLGLFGGGRDGYDDGGGGKYTHKVTEHELSLSQENAELKAALYANNKFDVLAAEVCELKKQIAVTAVKEQEFQRRADREYVHQPKASIRESIVVCRQGGCCDCDNRGHDEDRG